MVSGKHWQERALDEIDLERLVDRELKRLPQPRAPRSLLPRVMAAVAEPRPLKWYSRPWLAWPWALQAHYSLVVSLLTGC